MTVVESRPVTPGSRMPGPRRGETLLRADAMARNRLEVMSDVSAKYGDAIKLPLGPKTMYFFNHPETAKHVLADNAANYHKGIGLVHARRALGDGLLTSEGDLWKKQRKTIQPVFQARRINRQLGAVAEEAELLTARLKVHQGRGVVDVRKMMTELTLGVLGKTLLDADLGAFKSIGEDFEVIQDQAIFEMMSLNSVPHWLPLPQQLRFRKARASINSIVDQLAADRRARPTATGDDILSQLIKSTSEETDPEVAKTRMRDELVTLLLAGHETTATTLSWAFLLIDRHPEVRRRLHEEAVQVLGGSEPPTLADMHKLTYTGQVLEEVMRLYPPVWILPRMSVEDDEIGGYHVPAGPDVLICPYTLHRHPDFWEDPDRFDPERFPQPRPTCGTGTPTSRSARAPGSASGTAWA